MKDWQSNPRETRAERKQRIDVLLADLCSQAPGHPFSQEEIADYCGVSRQLISDIEREALKKVRAKLGEKFANECYRDERS